MANTTVIITQAGQTIEINQKGEYGHSDPWTFHLNVKRFLLKRSPDKFELQITARNAETQEEVCVHRYSPQHYNISRHLNDAYEVFQSLLTAIENKNGVWDARERT